MFTGIFKAVAVMSAEGAMLGLLLLLLKPLTKRIFGVKWQYYIWLTVLGVMLLPLSFFGNHKSSSAVGYIAATAQTAAVPHIGKTILTLAALIWCIGAAVSLGIRLFRYILFLRIIMRNSAPSQPIRVGTRILNTRRTQSLNAPILIGLFRPTLFLPDRDISEDAMSYILLHELTHYHRHDILYKWAAMLTCAIHWFNPIVYIISEHIDEDCEISCDADVTAKMDISEQKRYMNTILELIAAAGAENRSLTTGLATGKRLLKKRFSAILRKQIIKCPVKAISGFTAAALLFSAAEAGGILSANADMITAPITSVSAATAEERKESSENPFENAFENALITETPQTIGAEEKNTAANETAEYSEPQNIPQPSEPAARQSEKNIPEADKLPLQYDNTEAEESRSYNSEYTPDIRANAERIGKTSDAIPEAADTSTANTDEKVEASVGAGTDRQTIHQLLGEPDEATPEKIKETYSMDDGTTVIIKYENDTVSDGYRIIN